MKKNDDIIENALIVALIIVGSYQRIFLNISSYLDEILLIVILFYEVAKMLLNKSKVFEIKKMIIFVIFIVITMTNIFIKQYEPLAYFEEIFNFLKFIIIIELIKLIDINEKRYYKLMNILVLLNIISMIYGIINYQFYDVIGYNPGDKFRNGKLRIRGLAAHPIPFGFACLFIAIYLFEYKKKNKTEKFINYIALIISIYSLYLTKTRLPQFLLLVYFGFKFIYKIIQNFKQKKKKLIVFLSIIILLIISILSIIKINAIKIYLADDIENTIRMYALQKSYEIFQKYPIVGTGIGTFGGTASIKYDSYVYSEFNFNRFNTLINNSTGNVFESYFAKVLIETGIVGILFILYFLIEYYKIAKKTNDVMLLYVLMCMGALLLINNVYQLPFIIAVSLLISKNYNLIKNNK